LKTKTAPGNRPEPDFAGLRGADARGNLPEAQRPAWQKLWEQIESLRRRLDVAWCWACTVVNPDPGTVSANLTTQRERQGPRQKNLA
jgi:hypothetical protein